MLSKTAFLSAACLLAGSAGAATTVDFEDIALSPNSYYNGSDGAGGFVSRGVGFSNSYDKTWAFWDGFACSNVNDTTTAGYANQYAAATGTGFGGSGNYAIGYTGGAAPTITLPTPGNVSSVYVTNTTYALLAIRDGNDGFGAVRQFGDDPSLAGSGNQGFPDWFKLTITGKDLAGSINGTVDFYLADYRSADDAQDYVVDQWAPVDLSSLGTVKSLTFSLSSTDSGAWGMNTPAYFTMDNLQVQSVPEPAGLAALAAGLLLARRRRI